MVKLAVPFLGVLMFSMIPLCFFQTYKQFAEGMSDTKTAMVISVFSNILNLLLNYILIFGKLGFPEMGLMGSCWATFISRVCMALFMFFYVQYGPKFKNFRKELPFTSFSFPLIKKIMAIGVPSGLQFIFEIGAFSCAAIMAGWIGAQELAAHQITLSIAAITYMAASGIGAAASVRVGNFTGLNDTLQIRKAGFSAFLISGVFMTLSAILFIAWKNFLPSLFSSESEVISISSTLLVIAAFFQLSDGIQVVGLGVLRGMKDVMFPTLITLVSYWLISLPLSYGLAFTFGLGINGIWIGLLAGLSTAAISLFFRFSYCSKQSH